MKEERRFIRGIIPGLIFFIELGIVLLFVLCKSQKEDLIEKLSSGNIGTPLLIFLASGGIGYFLGIIYRFFYWGPCILKFSEILDRFRSSGIIDLRRWDSKNYDSSIFKEIGAWRIINEIFYSRKGESYLISGPEERNDRLFDNMHSSGTSLIGFIIVIIIGICVGHSGYKIISLRSLVLLFLLIIHFFEYFIARKNAFYFLEEVITNELYSYKEEHKQPLRIYFTKGNIKKVNKINLSKKG